jgi:Pectinacetylesterase
MLRRFIVRVPGTNTLALLARLLLLAALAATVAACGDSTTRKAAAPTTTQTPGTTAAAGDHGWERVVPGGGCQCSDGSQFSFWVRKANPRKVVFYLQGGGACFSAKTCAPGRDLYKTNIRSDDGPTGQAGMFDLAEKRNPFADYSIVYVPYCTGDVHIGNTTTTYAPGLTVHHKGYVNATAALDHLTATFPDATNVTVIGESAGSVAAPLYAGLASDRLPTARITVLADGSGSYPDVPRLNNIIAAWGTGNALPDWAKRGPNAKQWSFPGFFIQSARHNPKIVFARHDHAYDEVQERWYPLAGIPAKDLLSLIDANETQIERAGVNLLSYTAPGSEHTVLSDEPFYTEKVNGQRFLDWVTRLIAEQPVDDVHCQKCRAG